jgi:hypothetical protein
MYNQIPILKWISYFLHKMGKLLPVQTSNSSFQQVHFLLFFQLRGLYTPLVFFQLSWTISIDMLDYNYHGWN